MEQNTPSKSPTIKKKCGNCRGCLRYPCNKCKDCLLPERTRACLRTSCYTNSTPVNRIRWRCYWRYSVKTMNETLPGATLRNKQLNQILPQKQDVTSFSGESDTSTDSSDETPQFTGIRLRSKTKKKKHRDYPPLLHTPNLKLNTTHTPHLNIQVKICKKNPVFSKT